MRNGIIISLVSGTAALALWACGGSDATSGSGTGTGTEATSSSAVSSSSSSSASSSSSSSGTGGSGGSGGMGGAGGIGGAFDCVGKVMYPAPAAASVMLSAIAQDPQSGGPVSNVTVKACDKADTACANPLVQVVSDAQGKISATVPTPMPYGFDGFFQSSSAKTVTTNYFFRPIAAPPAAGTIALPVITAQQISLIGTLTGHPPDPARTNVAFVATDCADMSAAGVTFKIDTADASTAILYFVNNLPDPKATKTDPAGIAIALNLPPGPFNATMSVGGKKAGTLAGHAKAGEVAAIQLGPTP